MLGLVTLIVLATAQAGVFDDAGGEVVEVTAPPGERAYEVGDVVVRLRRSPGPDQLPTEPRCAADGIDLFVDGTPDPVEDAAIEAACRRLTTETITLPRASSPAEPGPRPDRWARPALRVLAGAWLLLLAACAPRRCAAWAWAAVGLAVRSAFPGPRILMPIAYPYERLLVYAGVKQESALYGAGWPALTDLLRPVFGAEGLHVAHLSVSVVTIAFAWEAARRLTGDRRVAHAAGALGAVLPLAVALARTEEAFVVCALLQVTAVLGLARGGRLGALLAATSAGLLGNVRPDQLPVALVVAVALVGARRWSSLVALVPLALRIRAVAASGNPEELGWDDVLRPLLHLVGRDSPTVLLDPWRTPLWLVPAAIAGWVVAGRRGWPRGWLVAIVVAGWAPYLVFERVTDLARFQLASSVTLTLLAAMSARSLSTWRRKTIAALVVAAGLALAARPLGGPMVQAVEHELLRTDVCALPEGTVVRYDASVDPDGGEARWVALRCGVRLLPVRGAPEPGSYLLIGRGNRSPGGSPPPACEVDVVRETFVAPYDGHVTDFGPEPVRIGLYRVRHCP